MTQLIAVLVVFGAAAAYGLVAGSRRGPRCESCNAKGASYFRRAWLCRKCQKRFAVLSAQLKALGATQIDLEEYEREFGDREPN